MARDIWKTIRDGIHNRVLDLATKKMKELIEDFIDKADKYAQTTANKVDDRLVVFLKETFGMDATQSRQRTPEEIEEDSEE